MKIKKTRMTIYKSLDKVFVCSFLRVSVVKRLLKNGQIKTKLLRIGINKTMLLNKNSICTAIETQFI